MTTPLITRVTMIKIPSEDHIPIALKGFEIFAKTQQKDGKPYIVSMQAGPAYGTMRDQGYTFVTKNVFRSKADMEFFETSCGAHDTYRQFMKSNVILEGLSTVILTPSLSFDF